MRTAKEILADQKFEITDPVEFAVKGGFDHGIVQDIVITPDGLLYGIVWSNKGTSKHYDFELKKPKGTT